ncbi:thioesterase-like superfamily-domain-containing protein [Xylogone sp. PMI_703]|nr:thioesterase-like superfamily-domain-containing protein [Xylogone sp. PMI_703]
MASNIRTSFAEAIKVTPLQGTENSQFEATVPWDWCGGTHAHGGYINSLLMSTARTYFLSKYASQPQPDPINIHVQYILPVEIGKVRLLVDELSIKKRYSVVQISLQKQHPKSLKFQTHVLVIVTQGNLATEQGQTISIPPMISKSEIPDRRTACEEFILPTWLKKLLPVANNFRTFKRTGGKSRFLSRKGLNVKDFWTRWADETQKFDLISLGIVCDNFFSAPTNFYDDLEDLKQYVYPTTCISIEVKKDPGNAAWLFVEVVSNQIKNGRFDQEVHVFDEEGDLVALSKHVSTAIDLKWRNPKNVTQSASSTSKL